MNCRCRALFFFATISCILFACDNKVDSPEVHKLDGTIAGYKYEIIYSGDTTGHAAAVDSIFLLVENAFSPALPNSVVARYNAFTRTDTMFCFRDQNFLFGTVWDMSSEVWRKAMNYWDPTIGPLRRAWVQSALLRDGSEPNLDSLSAFVGYDESRFVFIEQFDDDKTYRESQLRKPDLRTELDFGKMPYAYALDLVGTYFQDRGVVDYKLTLDDVVVCSGFENDTTSAIVLTAGGDSLRLFNRAIAIKDATDKAAYVDPTWGYPLLFDTENTKEYVYVLAPNAAFAEAYAQAFMMMDSEEVSSFYTNYSFEPVDVMILDKFEGEWRSSFTDGFSNAVINTSVTDTLNVQ